MAYNLKKEVEKKERLDTGSAPAVERASRCGAFCGLWSRRIRR